MASCDIKNKIMWKYELEYRIDKPETEGETDKHFDLDNYKDWLEEQLTECRKQLSIHNVSNSVICCPQCGNERLESTGGGWYICGDRRCDWGDKL